MEKKNPYAQIWIAVDESQRVIGRRNGKTGDFLRIGDAIYKALTTGQIVYCTELVSRDFLAAEDEELAKRVKDTGIVQFVISPVMSKSGASGAIISGIVISGDAWLGNTIHNKFGAEMAIFAGEPPESSFLHATASLPRNTWIIGQPFPKELKDNVLHGKSYFGIVKIGENEHMAAFEPIVDSQNRAIGAFGVSKPADDMQDAIFGILWKGAAVAALIGLLLAAALVIFTYLDIVRPIKFLVDAMAGFGRGDLDVSLDLKTGDEFEKLGAGFNVMADGIRKREDRLSKHYEVAKLLMSTLDLRELIEKMLKIVIDVTNSEMGVLYLCEESETGEVLVPHVFYGTKAELPTLKMGEGHPGRAAMDKKIIFLESPKSPSSEVLELGFVQVLPNQIANLPLVYKGKILGVLVLGTVKEYSEEDRHIFDYLSSQMAISLDNAIMHQKIQELSITDPLTRLYNRRYLNTRLEEEWSRSVRNNQPLSCILSDADNFKKVNDIYGHDKGDEVLRGIADNIRKSIRKEDIGARFGGEEFVIVLPNTTSQNALIIAERIRRESESKVYEWMGRSVTLSIGIATFPELSLKNFDELVHAADQAMYKAKVGGKNMVIISDGTIS
ncbi:MAG: diguanylate cyclase, partial [Gallionella sp.]|nr:diguanylate cyclase [Gallionella sp.]